MTDDETEALRARAELEQQSMQDVARRAIRTYIEDASRRDLINRAMNEDLRGYSEALRRLGE